MQSKPGMLTLDEYLKLDETSETRYEYVGGHVFAMSGATANHQLLMTRLAGLLLTHAEKSGCRAYASGMKVHAVASDSVYYPDVVVHCGPMKGNTSLITDPVLVIEILSRSTKSIDCREKWTAYKRIDSLQEYVIVNQWRPQLDLWRREPGDQWNHSMLSADDKLVLTSAGTAGEFVLPMAELYKGVDFSPPGFEVHEDVESGDDYGSW
jgi:Uma2 family endonuclease